MVTCGVATAAGFFAIGALLGPPMDELSAGPGSATSAGAEASLSLLAAGPRCRSAMARVTPIPRSRKITPIRMAIRRFLSTPLLGGGGEGSTMDTTGADIGARDIGADIGPREFGADRGPASAGWSACVGSVTGAASYAAKGGGASACSVCADFNVRSQPSCWAAGRLWVEGSASLGAGTTITAGPAENCATGEAIEAAATAPLAPVKSCAEGIDA